MIFNMGGGGAPLNFSVKAYASDEDLMASVPKENTIGIITSTAIAGWFLSHTEPADPVEGTVWIALGTSGPVVFNALKKNGIQVYPISAKQYISGAWVEVVAKSYQTDAWAEWKKYLYISGNECTDLTGGWRTVYYDSSNPGTVTKEADRIKMTCSSSDEENNVDLLTTNKISFADVDTLSIKVTARSGMNNSEGWIGAYMVLTTKNGYISYPGEQTYSVGITRTGTFTIDVSEIGSTTYYVGLSCSGASIEFTEISMV